MEIGSRSTVYREFVPVIEELHQWDVILLHGEVKLIGMAMTHLPRCPREEWLPGCVCFVSARITSSIVDKWKKPLCESGYSSDPTTGAARHLLSLEDGDEVEVLSGKVYRLVGPRRINGYDGFASGSIWVVYAEPEKEARVRWWVRLAGACGLARAGL